MLVFCTVYTTSVNDELSVVLALKSSLQHSNLHIFSIWFYRNHIFSFTGISRNDSGNGLFDTLPFDPICSFFPSIQKLAFGFNSLSGDNTNHLSSSTRLEYLDLCNNQFFGPFLDASSLSSLKYLYLKSSWLSIVFSWKSLSNNSNLIELSLGDNNFRITPFPKEVTKLRSLTGLYLSNCNISRSILSEIGNLTWLVNLELWEIPPEFREFKNLVNLSLYSNILTGMLPTKLGSLAKFNLMNVSRKFLSGLIPPNMCNKGSLTKLLLFQNTFYRNISSNYVPPSIWGLRNLNILDVGDNDLEESISINISKALKLNRNFAGNNKLCTIFPDEVGAALSLILLDLSRNRLNGQDCFQLTDINLAENQFSGKILESLGSLPLLKYLNLPYNSSSGQIPNTLSSLTLIILDLTYNHLLGYILSSFSIGAYKEGFVGNDVLCDPTVTILSHAH
ncbi:hypothetical protein RND81_01G106300 [Saponaria officinalis]|uniref:Uncharacterized protein n=1 Tax=Saponaria officinalis TaxID=3572 RepID=A0AAW1N6W9_SAPOF